MLFAKPTVKHILFSDEWPAATSFVCDSESKKVERAAQIVERFIGDVSNKRVLDFGCGEGHLVSAIENSTSVAVGYDIVDPRRDRCFCEWDKIRSFSPYDVIILHDVIDHVTDQNMALDVLLKARSVLDDGGTIFVRCHPFCSRTGSHQFHWLNKAYLHLVFSEAELGRIGIPHTNVLRVLRPQRFYSNLFAQTEFLILDMVVEYCRVEKFFEENGEVRSRILNNWPEFQEFPYHQMEQHYVFYKLAKD